MAKTLAHGFPSSDASSNASTVSSGSLSGGSSRAALAARIESARRAFPLASSSLTTCGLLIAIASSSSACSTRHVRLTSPDTDPGARYVCKSSGCSPADSDVPADDNPSNTTDVTLPRECGGKFHQILIIDAGSSEPSLRVTCAPAEEPIGTMGEPEAANTTRGEQ